MTTSNADEQHAAVSAGRDRSGDAGQVDRLVLDLSAIGIPTTYNTFALRVEGHAMSGAGIYIGDVLVLERREPRLGESVVVLVDGHAMFKRYVESKEDGPVLCDLKPADDAIATLEGVEIQGVAVGLIRKL